MPRTRKEEAPVLVREPEITGRYVELADYTVSFEEFHTDIDPAPLFHGLPDDRCQCPHWGVVSAGRLDVRYADRTETFTEGDVYYIAPGHLPHPHQGTQLVEFSPTSQLQDTMAVLASNMATQTGGAR